MEDNQDIQEEKKTTVVSTKPLADSRSLPTVKPYDVSREAPEKLSREYLSFQRQSQTASFKLQQGLKRLADLVLVSIGILLVSPLLLILVLMVRLSSPGPVIYESRRIGKDGRPFSMYKFRTMVPDADSIRDRLRQEAHLEGQLFKLENDPRITPIGHLLRAYSLDELPQLLNVLRGNMSLVGPRPLPEDESGLFDPPYTLRYKVLPGITGPWQVGGRSSLGFEQLSELELEYVLGWSLWRDLIILLKTVPTVLLRRGAY